MAAPLKAVDGNADRTSDLLALMSDLATRARAAARVLALAPPEQKNRALEAMERAIRNKAAAILAANAEDVAAAKANGISPAFLDRLTLSEKSIEQMAAGVEQVAALEDPVGRISERATRPTGIEVARMRVPLGVVGIVYEARPNVTVDAAGLTLKAGNAVLLRGSSNAEQSNIALVKVLREVLADNDFPADAVQLLPCHDRASVHHLITARGLVDLVIPRGGAGLISAVVQQATVPTIETGVGNCHVYVDRSADLEMAHRILINSKTRRPSVCNAAETVLVHQDVAEPFVPEAVRQLKAHGVTVHGDKRAAELADVVPAVDADWDTEYLSLDIAMRVVDSLDEAVEHIGEHGSGHTEAIVSDDVRAAREFVARVDAAAVMVNAATSFTDGGEMGLGAEIGISTQKLHARGPMGLAELTSTKWVVWGDGHVRASS